MIRLAPLILLLSAILCACQQGKRKDGETAVYSTGVQACKEISAELEQYDIQLNGPSPTIKGVEIKLPSRFLIEANVREPQRLLEKYLLTSQQLLALGDTKTVIFPEKEEIQIGYQRANKYLAHIYANRKWTQHSNPVRNPELDMAEFELRLGRLSRTLKKVEAMGIPAHLIDSQNLVVAQFKKAKVTALKSLRKDLDLAIIDVVRMKELTDRNNGWSLAGLRKMADSYEAMGGAIYKLGELADDAITSRQNRQ